MDGRESSSLSPHPSPCMCKNYKKDGRECGQIKCKKHVLHEIPELTRWIRPFPSPLCYQTISGVFPHLNTTVLISDTNQTSNSNSLLESVLQYVYCFKTLVAFSKTLGYKPKSSSTMEDVLRPIAAFMRHCWHIESSSRRMDALRCFQRHWRERRRLRLSLSLSLSFVNAEDPITMERLSDIPEIHRWSYKDSKGNCYGFHASSLLHFIDTQGAWNPYTRESIPEEDIVRLRNHVADLSQDDKMDFTVVWHSPRDAFADILYDYEKYGFYTSMDWFLNLTPMNIIDIYTLLNKDPFIPKSLFQLSDLETSIFQDPERGAAYYMAREMQTIIKDNHDFKFYIVCNIFVAMAKVCPYIRRSLPPWTQAGARAIT